MKLIANYDFRSCTKHQLLFLNATRLAPAIIPFSGL
uniref:Uncharacterized protein n=1 Tax=Arundo donax TaxID=35708 RepID=A0A0A9F5X1_ARUDO